MMKNYDESVEVNHSPNWPYIPDHPCRILIVGGSGSGKTNVLLNLIKHQQPSTLTMEEKNWGLNKQKIPKAFINHSQTIDDVYENLEDYNHQKKNVNSAWWYDNRYGS